jgi:hypothetical protein
MKINRDLMREPTIIINLSLPPRIKHGVNFSGESNDVKTFWIPAFAGMTVLDVAISLTSLFL